MALFDKLKDMLKGREDQVRNATEKVGGAVGKVGEFVDEKTKGKYSDKISSAGQKTQEAIHKAGDKVAAVSAEEDGTAPDGTTTAPVDPPPAAPTAAPAAAASDAADDATPEPPPAAGDGVGTDKPEGTTP
jgi:MT0933-like antitoxin protein